MKDKLLWVGTPQWPSDTHRVRTFHFFIGDEEFLIVAPTSLLHSPPRKQFWTHNNFAAPKTLGPSTGKATQRERERERERDNHTEREFEEEDKETSGRRLTWKTEHVPCRPRHALR
jgi:hypothetical protein